MKRLNKFSRLPQEDQTLILNLCAKMSYRAAAEILAKPREEGGLSFTTCPSALCKFVYQQHPEAVATEAFGQFAAAIRFQHQAHGEANFEAILAMIQNRVLESLRAGKPLANLHQDLRSLQRAQKCFLDDNKFRHKNPHTQDAYLEGVKVIAAADGPDFVDHTLEEDPGAGGATPEDFQAEETQLELDLFCAKHLPAAEVTPTATYFREAARIVAARRLAERKQAFLHRHDVNPLFAMPELAHPTPEGLLKLQQQLERLQEKQKEKQLKEKEISNQNPSKTPTISTISNNFHSPEKGAPDGNQDNSRPAHGGDLAAP